MVNWFEHKQMYNIIYDAQKTMHSVYKQLAAKALNLNRSNAGNALLDFMEN